MEAPLLSSDVAEDPMPAVETEREPQVALFCETALHAVAAASRDFSALPDVAPGAESQARGLLESFGAVPLVGLKLCFPPTGIYFDLSMLALGYASHFGQVLTFLQHSDWVIAGLMLLILAVALHYTYLLIFAGSSRGVTFTLLQFLRRLRISARSGVQDTELRALLCIGSSTTGAFGTLLAPYRLLGTGGLSWLSAANAAMGLMLHAKGMGDELMGNNLGDLQRQYGKAVVKSCPGGKNKCLALQLWAYGSMSAQITLTAIVAYVWHPLVAVLLFIPVAITYADANYTLMEEQYVGHFSRRRLFLNCFLEPAHLLAPLQSSVFGLQQWDTAVNANLGNVPARSHCQAQALRMLAIGALLLFVDFPDAPIRPMGSSVLQAEVLEPAIGIISGRLSADAAFRAFILVVATMTLPVYCFGTGALCLLNPYFRDGERDAVANARMDEMTWEVQNCLFGQSV